MIKVITSYHIIYDRGAHSGARSSSVWRPVRGPAGRDSRSRISPLGCAPARARWRRGWAVYGTLYRRGVAKIYSVQSDPLYIHTYLYTATSTASRRTLQRHRISPLVVVYSSSCVSQRPPTPWQTRFSCGLHLVGRERGDGFGYGFRV